MSSVRFFRMRARDPDCAPSPPTYRSWTVTETPDTTGALYTGTRCGVSPLEDIVVTSMWVEDTTPQETFTPEQFGAIGDGSTDDTTAFQDAIDAAEYVHGTVLLSARKYRITAPLECRSGQFVIKGCGWFTNVSELYDTAGTQYEGYREHPSDPVPAFYVSGSVIFADTCAAFVRDDLPNATNFGRFTADSFAVVGNSLATAFDFGDIGTYTNATFSNTFNNVGVFRFNIGFDISLQYYAVYVNCTVRGCKEAIRCGTPDTATNSSGGNNARFYGLDVQSNDKCIALYEASNISVDGFIAQGHKTVLYVKPNDSNVVTNIVLSHAYLESNESPNRLFHFDNADAGVARVMGASYITLDDITHNGNNYTALDFGSGSTTYSSIFNLTVKGVIKNDEDVTIPLNVFRTVLENCQFNSVDMSAAPTTQLRNVAVLTGGHQASGYLTKNVSQFVNDRLVVTRDDGSTDESLILESPQADLSKVRSIGRLALEADSSIDLVSDTSVASHTIVTGTPEGVVTAPEGSIVHRSIPGADGQPKATLYIKASGDVSTTIDGVQTLPAGTITVISAASFASSGAILIISEANGLQVVTYSGKTGTTFTGCSGGVGSIENSSLVLQNSATGWVALQGFTTVTFPSDADYTVTATNYSVPVLYVTSAGSLSATRNLILPLSQGREWLVFNKTTGSQDIIVKGSTGSGVTISNNAVARVVTDGTNFYGQASGQGITGKLSVSDLLVASNGLTVNGAQLTANSSFYAANITYLGQAVASFGEIYPTALNGTVNNYAPTGISTALSIYQDASSNSIVNAISSSGVDGRWLWWTNTSTLYTQTFIHEEVGQTAVNRFDLPGERDLIIPPGGSVILHHQLSSTGDNRWHVIATSFHAYGAAVAELNDTTTNTVLSLLTLRRKTTGTQAAGLGEKISFELEKADGSVAEAAKIEVISTNTTGRADIAFSAYSTAHAAMLERMRVTPTGVRIVLGSVAADYLETVAAGTGLLRVDPAGAMSVVKFGAISDGAWVSLGTGRIGLGYIRQQSGTFVPDARLELQDHYGYAGSGWRFNTGAINTTSATTTTNATLTVALEDNYAYSLRAEVVCRISTGAIVGRFVRVVSAYRSGGGAVLSTADGEGVDDITVAGLDVSAEANSNNIRWTVTSPDASTYYWSVRYQWHAVSTDS